MDLKIGVSLITFVCLGLVSFPSPETRTTPSLQSLGQRMSRKQSFSGLEQEETFIERRVGVPTSRTLTSVGKHVIEPEVGGETGKRRRRATRAGSAQLHFRNHKSGFSTMFGSLSEWCRRHGEWRDEERVSVGGEEV